MWQILVVYCVSLNCRIQSLNTFFRNTKCYNLRFNWLIFTEKLFNSQIIDQISSSNKSLNQHKKANNRSKAFKCDVCLKVFSYQSILKTHYRTHTGEKPFACQICDEKFATKSNLSSHLKFHTKSKYIYTNKIYFK